MSARQLANPPLLDTDIPTNDAFVTHEREPAALQNQLSKTIDFRDRFNSSQGQMAATDRVPAGFADSQYLEGLAATVCLPKIDQVHEVRLAIHPIGQSVPSYGHNWTLSDSPLNETYWQSNPYYNVVPYGVLGAQRLGTTMYALTNYTALRNPTATTFDGSTYEALSLARITGLNDIDVLVWNQDGVSNTPPLDLAAQADIFVSDDELPFIWLRENFGPERFVTGFWDNRTSSNPAWSAASFTNGKYVPQDNPFLGKRVLNYNPQTGTNSVAQYGQLAAFRQQLPDSVLDAKLVHPWSAGDYGPPELWMIEPVDVGVFNVYSAPWTRGAWSQPPNYTFGDNQLSAGTRFPTFNPFGYGFDMHVDAAHQIGTVSLPNPSILDLGFGYEPDFHFFRDTDLPDVMHLAVVRANDGGSQNNNQ